MKTCKKLVIFQDNIRVNKLSFKHSYKLEWNKQFKQRVTKCFPSNNEQQTTQQKSLTNAAVLLVYAERSKICIFNVRNKSQPLARSAPKKDISTV